MFDRGERSDGFVFVGSEVLPGDVSVSYEDVDGLRSYVMNEYFGHVPTKTPHVSETSDKTVGSKGFYRYTPGFEENVPSIYTGALVHHTTQTSWRMRVMISRMRRIEWNNAEQRVMSRFRFEVIGGQLVEATKSAQIIRGVGELGIAQLMTGQVIERQRKMYERPVEEEDLSDITASLQRTVRRLQAQ